MRWTLSLSPVYRLTKLQQPAQGLQIGTCESQNSSLAITQFVHHFAPRFIPISLGFSPANEGTAALGPRPVRPVLRTRARRTPGPVHGSCCLAVVLLLLRSRITFAAICTSQTRTQKTLKRLELAQMPSKRKRCNSLAGRKGGP